MNVSTTTPWARTAFGIDENAGAPLIIKATRRGKTLSFQQAKPDDVASAGTNTVVSACLLQRESFVRWVTAPIASPRKAESVFPSLLDIQLPFPVEDCEISLLKVIPSPDKTATRGFVAGARVTDIAKRLDSLTAIGVNPHLLDQESIALWTQSLEEIPEIGNDNTVRVVAYLSPDRITLAAGRGGELTVAHTMKQMDPGAVHRFLKSAFPDSPPSLLWLWTGPGAIKQEVTDSFYQSLAERWPGHCKTVREPEMFLARALARRALTTGCNLRSGPFMHPELARREAARPLQYARLLLAAGITLCLVNIVWLTAVHRHDNRLQNQLRTIATDIIGSRSVIPKGQEARTAQQAFEVQAKNMEPFLAAVDAPLRTSLNTILAAARDEGVAIESLNVNPRNGVVHATAPKLAQGEAMGRRLERNGWTVTVERKDATVGSEETAFVIGLGHSREK